MRSHRVLSSRRVCHGAGGAVWKCVDAAGRRTRSGIAISLMRPGPAAHPSPGPPRTPAWPPVVLTPGHSELCPLGSRRQEQSGGAGKHQEGPDGCRCKGSRRTGSTPDFRSPRRCGPATFLWCTVHVAPGVTDATSALCQRTPSLGLPAPTSSWPPASHQLGTF